MELQKYDLRLNKERNKSVLVKECCFSYPGYSLNNPEKIVAVKNKPPYVCNGCSQLPKCTLLKSIYDPADAHEKAHHAISEARTGIMSNEDDIAKPTGERHGYV